MLYTPFIVINSVIIKKEKRRQAYEYIVENLCMLKLHTKYITDKGTSNTNYISLAQIEGLKKGLIDPTD
jgi:hypothetical protein